jgi:hypothetical protein
MIEAIIIVFIKIISWDQDGNNKIVVNNAIIIMFEYSAIKIKAKGPALNSMLKPETNSDSPSGKSNGARLVSAKTEIIHNRIIRGSVIAGIINFVKMKYIFIELI